MLNRHEIATKAFFVSDARDAASAHVELGVGFRTACLDRFYASG